MIPPPWDRYSIFENALVCCDDLNTTGIVLEIQKEYDVEISFTPPMLMVLWDDGSIRAVSSDDVEIV